MENSSIQLKAMLTEMFRWFHVFCEKNQLRYYVLGGTMLGAVRHEGFIPWDDDIDVGMPRKDYIRFEKLMKNYSGRYVLETPNTAAMDYFYPYAKLYDTETTLSENTRYKIKRGIYLDIFPLDGSGNTKKESCDFFKREVETRQNWLLAATTGYRKGRSFYKNAVIAMIRCIPNCILNKKRLLLSLVEACSQKDFDQCEWGGNLVGNWLERELMPRSIMGKPTEYTFEGMTVWGPEDYDGYLTSLYGNWRELPPEDKRVSHHDFLCVDLTRSYLENNHE